MDDEFEITIETPRSPRSAEDINLDLSTPRQTDKNTSQDITNEFDLSIGSKDGHGDEPEIHNDLEDLLKDNGLESAIMPQGHGDDLKTVKPIQTQDISESTSTHINTVDHSENIMENQSEFNLSLEKESNLDYKEPDTVVSPPDNEDDGTENTNIIAQSKEFSDFNTEKNKDSNDFEIDEKGAFMSLADIPPEDHEEEIDNELVDNIEEMTGFTLNLTDPPQDVENTTKEVPQMDSNNEQTDEVPAMEDHEITNEEVPSMKVHNIINEETNEVKNVEDSALVTDEITEDTINLENILMREKAESDSDSEFDFELPPSVTTATVAKANIPTVVVTTPVVKDTTTTTETTVSVTENRVSQHAASTDNKVVQQNSAPDNHVTKETTPDQSTISSHHKPVAVIKPSPQVVETHNETEEPESEDVNNEVLVAAQNEWDKVTTITAGYKNESTVTGTEPTVVRTVAVMSPYELMQIFKEEEDYTSVRSTIRPCVERRGFAAFVNLLFGPPKLNRSLMEDRDTVFCIAASQLNNENSGHMRTLQTIYRCLTGSKFDCPRLGSHWEQIGFQGNDPATDLRGAGLLGLLHLVYFLKDPKKQTLASDVYRLSLHPTQNFPFCVMGLNLTRIALQTLREQQLNKECNRCGDVFFVMNEFYVALYLQLYQTWKRGKTISDSGFIIKDLEDKAKKNPRALLKNLEDYMNRKTNIDVSERLPDTGGENFVNVCDDS